MNLTLMTMNESSRPQWQHDLAKQIPVPAVYNLFKNAIDRNGAIWFDNSDNYLKAKRLYEHDVLRLGFTGMYLIGNTVRPVEVKTPVKPSKSNVQPLKPVKGRKLTLKPKRPLTREKELDEVNLKIDQMTRIIHAFTLMEAMDE